MNIQINGTKKSSDTRKAERFFSERSIPYHLRDVIEKPLAPREIENILRSIDADDLIDTESKSYKKRGFAHMMFDPVEELQEDPGLMRMPVVRNGDRATIGYQPDVWTEWLEKDS